MRLTVITIALIGVVGGGCSPNTTRFGGGLADNSPTPPRLQPATYTETSPATLKEVNQMRAARGKPELTEKQYGFYQVSKTDPLD